MIVGTFTFYNEFELIPLQMEVMLSICDKIICLGDNPTNQVMDIMSAYRKENLVDIYVNKKNNQVLERDEWGDREFLLTKCKEIGATACYHTDIDEIIKISDVSKVKNLLKNYDDSIYAFRKLNFWGSAYHYRLDNSKNFAGQQIENIQSINIERYIYPIKNHSTYLYKKIAIPNYHCPRIPFYLQSPIKLIDDITILHYGYYRQSLINEKGEFYKQAGNFADNCWGKDMQMSLEEYKNTYGVGILKR